MVLKMAPLVRLTNEKLQMKNFLWHLLKDELHVLNKVGKTSNKRTLKIVKENFDFKPGIISINFDPQTFLLVQKSTGYAKSKCLSAETDKKMDGLFVSAGGILKAPWDEMLCAVPDIDKWLYSVVWHARCRASYLLLKSFACKNSWRKLVLLFLHCWYQ